MEKQRILAANLGRRNRGSHLERDKRRQRVALAIAVVVVLMVIAIPIYGWVTTFVLPPREVIVRVNDVEYDMGYLVKLMRMVQRQTEAGGQTVNLGTVPFQLVQDLATNELVVQGAQSQGLQVTPEELTQSCACAPLARWTQRPRRRRQSWSRSSRRSTGNS